ncbi:MAG: hypothetical protein QOG54_2808 [Actinomycetota bacterium]|jgi:hypothetical protein|nr:hypothetical protein [Actinomycetota bacterium]
MRFSRVASLATGVLVIASAFTPAQAGPLDPKFQTQRVYFHCNGSTRIGNVNLVAEEAVPSWNTTAPDSVTGGEGCLTGDVVTPLAIDPEENPADGVWKGTFTGNLDTLTVNVHQMLGDGWLADKAEVSSSYGIRLNVDGQRLVDTEDDAVVITGTSANSGVTHLLTFSIKDLGLIEPNLDTNGDGIGDNPYGSQQHTITLNIDAVDAVFDMWAYDTDETDSGITFNPASLSNVIIPATGTPAAARRHHGRR